MICIYIIIIIPVDATILYIDIGMYYIIRSYFIFYLNINTIIFATLKVRIIFQNKHYYAITCVTNNSFSIVSITD